MKRDSNHPVTLLDNLAGDGVSVDRVLQMVRDRRAAKRRTTFMAASASLVVLLTVGLLWIEARPWVQKPVSPRAVSFAVTVPPPPEPFHIAHVDDEGLLDLLQGQPLALVEHSDGRQELMIIVNSVAGRRVTGSRP